MGKVSMAVRSAAMSHIEPRLPAILGRDNMRTKILKVIVVLLLSGSGEARPQKTEEPSPSPVLPSNSKPEEWRTAVREDSRYTWNSGSSSVPYTNYYRDNIDPSVERKIEVSVAKSRDPESTDPRSRSNFLLKPRLKNAIKPILRTQQKSIDDDDDDNDRIANVLQEQASVINNSSGSRSTIDRHFARGAISRVSRKSAQNSSVENFEDRKFHSAYARVPLLDSRISLLNRVSGQWYGSRNDPLKQPFRISKRISLNNSLKHNTPVASNQATKFFSEKDSPSSSFSSSSSSAVNVASSKVEAGTPLDHAKAIKKITSGMLIREPESLSLGGRNGVEQRIPSVLPSRDDSNPRSSSRKSNGTKTRRPANRTGVQKKKNPNKIRPNKISNHGNVSATSNHRNSTSSMNYKNWPNAGIRDEDDFQNYDRYTSMDVDQVETGHLGKPFPPQGNSSITYHVPLAGRPDLQEIIHWLKIPAFMSNGSHVVESDQVGGPINVAFDPVYQNLEPNRPSEPGIYQTQKPPRPVNYGVEKVPSWLEYVSLRNKTPQQDPHVYSPQTQVSQNTVVHLINTDLRKPNKTITGSMVPVGQTKPITDTLGSPSGSTSSSNASGTGPSLILSQLLPSSSSTVKPGPNVHIGFTSYEENNQMPVEQVAQTPLVTYDHSCPTILINSYTRINNTIQSKDGCADLNIIINSHVFNTNIYKTTASPLTQQAKPDNYVEADKYGSQVEPDIGYQPAPTYQSSSGGSQVYYDTQKDPQDQSLQQDGVSNSVEVVQDTHISISNSAEAEAEASPEIEASLAEAGEAGSSEDTVGTSAVSDPGGDSLNGSPGANSLTRPAETPALSGPVSSGTSSSPQAGLASGASPPARPSSDDDDEEYDLSPSGIMESIASLFTYFTFVNPLHYGFFSLAAAPFTALAAGVLGIVTFLYPWFSPSSYGFSRSTNDGEDSFWRILENVARQSLENYGRVNEWKSKKKKKRKR